MADFAGWIKEKKLIQRTGRILLFLYALLAGAVCSSHSQDTIIIAIPGEQWQSSEWIDFPVLIRECNRIDSATIHGRLANIQTDSCKCKKGIRLDIQFDMATFSMVIPRFDTSNVSLAKLFEFADSYLPISSYDDGLDSLLIFNFKCGDAVYEFGSLGFRNGFPEDVFSFVIWGEYGSEFPPYMISETQYFTRIRLRFD